LESVDEDTDWLLRFRNLNARQDKQLIFRLGVRQGFFSEINNMLLAVLYCLRSNIRFVLSSKGGTFGVHNGWTDYFVPIFEEHSDPIERRLNTRHRVDLTRVERLGAALYKRLTGVDYLTQDLFHVVRDRLMEAYEFEIAELEIRGDLLDASEALIRRVWKFNEQTRARIAARSNNLGLPTEYIGLHVRRGDKKGETPVVGLERYAKLLRASGLNSVFLATDDFSVVEAFERELEEYDLFTLCSPNQRGYWQDVHVTQPAWQRDAQTIQLLAEIEILRRSTKFVGTFTSNVGMFIGMSRAGRECYGADFRHWRIW
jgi:hypothetical protein